MPGTLPAPRLRAEGLVFDIGAPIAVYYFLHGAGVSNLVALAAGAVLPALGALWQLAARLVVHVPAGSGLITGIWGAWFLATPRPAEGRRVFAVRRGMVGRRAALPADGGWPPLVGGGCWPTRSSGW